MFLTLDCSLAGGTIPLEFVRMPYMAGKLYDTWGQQPGTTLEPISKLTPVNAGVNYLAPLSSLQTREAALSSVHSYCHSLSYRKDGFMRDRRMCIQ